MSRNIIFDMDGVIFDSERAILEVWKELGIEQLDNIERVYARCIGTTDELTREIFLGEYGADFPYDYYVQKLFERFNEKYSDGRLPLKDGVKELLSFLRDNSYGVALASSTKSALVRKQIKNADLTKYFDIIIGGEMAARSKPAPDIFLEAARQLNAEPSKAFVVEDSFNGIRAAHSGGFIPIMVPDLLPPDDEMRSKAKFIVKNLNNVIELVDTADDSR